MNPSTNKNEGALGFHEFIDDKKSSALTKYQTLVIGSKLY